MFWYTLIKTVELEKIKTKSEWVWYYLWSPIDKFKNDKQLKSTIPDHIAKEDIKDILIDRKQWKMVILIK